MSWQEGTGFRVVGTVVRAFVAPSGKFGKLTLKVNEPPHPPQLEFKTQDRIVAGDIGQLRQGMRIQVTGKIQSEKVQEKVGDGYEDIKINGYPVWVPVLRPVKFEFEGSSRPPQSKSENRKSEREPGADDGDPMGGAGADPMGGGRDPFGG